MATLCTNVHEWIEEQVEQPIETWENQQQQQCQAATCNWLTLCLNVLTCWMVWVAVKVVRFTLVTVGKWITRLVCEVVSALLDVAALTINLLLSVPLLGGIARTVLNWLKEGLWRTIGLITFVLSLLGIRPRKRMYVGLLIPRRNGAPVTTEAVMMPQIQMAQQLLLSLCNVELIYTGVCEPSFDAPKGATVVECGGGGFFGDWGLAGAYFEYVAATCQYTDGWRRVLGYGGGMLVIAVDDVLPAPSVGCSFLATHSYVLVEPGLADLTVTAHEIGHACLLGHHTSSSNLMYESTGSPTPILTNFQIAMVRSSRHCVYV